MDINWALILPFIIIQFVLMIVAIIDWVKVKETNGPKLLWLFVIIFVNIFGPILYFIFGRKDHY